MKNVKTLVAVFLIGITTQAFANNRENVEIDPIKIHRYSNSQTIQFVENGVLYSVSKLGVFHFKILSKNPNRINNGGRRGYSNVTYYNNAHNHGRYNNCDNGRNGFVTKDRYGRVRSIGNTYITYKDNGMVRTVGSIKLKYYDGRLGSVGDMDIEYNRHGEFRSTYGYINSENRRDWHNDWYVYNEDDFPGNHSTRNRS